MPSKCEDADPEQRGAAADRCRHEWRLSVSPSAAHTKALRKARPLPRRAAQCKSRRQERPQTSEHRRIKPADEPRAKAKDAGRPLAGQDERRTRRVCRRKRPPSAAQTTRRRVRVLASFPALLGCKPVRSQIRPKCKHARGDWDGADQPSWRRLVAVGVAG